MFREAGWGEPQPFFMPSLALAGTDARRGLAVAPEKATTVAAVSGAVPVIREAQRRSLTPTGMALPNHRITANTGWVHRSSAKAPSSLQQHNEPTQEQAATV